MADFLTLKDYFLSRGYDPDVFGNWSGFKKTINNIQLSFFEIKKAKNKLIMFNGKQIKIKKILEGLKNRPVSHIVQLVLQAEKACESDHAIKIFTPKLNGEITEKERLTASFMALGKTYRYEVSYIQKNSERKK